jgi:hypothetical protein
MPNVIKTYSGVMFDLVNFNPEDILIEDIAHSLSLTASGGHSNCLYSVAQHCVWCAQQEGVFFKGLYRRDMQYPLYRLMHDGAEAYLGDIVTPLKVLLPEYKKREDALLDMIYQKFCGGSETDLIEEEVKFIDRKALDYEMSFIWEDHCHKVAWSAKKSEREFLKMFKRLSK